MEVEDRLRGDPRRRQDVTKPRYSQMKAVFYNVSMLCGTAIVVAMTVKVIMSLFS